MEGGGPRDDARGGEISPLKLPGAGATLRQRNSCFRGRGAGPEQSEQTVDRCSFSRRIQGRDHAHAGVSAGRRAARRSYSGREKCALENGGERGRYVQTSSGVG